MTGPPENRWADPAAWQRPETELGLRLPADYKTIVDTYAPILLNRHLDLHHPASPVWNLGQWIEETVQALSEVDWDGRSSSPTRGCSGQWLRLHHRPVVLLADAGVFRTIDLRALGRAVLPAGVGCCLLG